VCVYTYNYIYLVLVRLLVLLMPLLGAPQQVLAASSASAFVLLY
jgi:hypothetical protein